MFNVGDKVIHKPTSDLCEVLRRNPGNYNSCRCDGDDIMDYYERHDLLGSYNE